MTDDCGNMIRDWFEWVGSSARSWTVRATFADVLACHARPVVLGALFVFGEATARFAAQNRLGVETIAHMPFSMWKPEESPLCKARIPIEKISDTT
jgi:hypothetical protein